MPNNLKVLIIENNKTIRKFIKTNLMMNGIPEPYLAENGLQGLTILENRAFDLIILNWEIPKLDGYSFLKKLSEQKLHIDQPIFVLTSDPNKENISKIITAGATELIVKPFVFKTLLQKINRIFSEDKNKTKLSRLNRVFRLILNKILNNKLITNLIEALINQKAQQNIN